MPSTLKKHKNLLPVLFLLILCLYTAYRILFTQVEVDGNLYDLEFSTAQLLGLAAVLVNIAIYFLFRQIFKYSVGFTIIAGLFGLLNFTLHRYTFTMGALTFNQLSFLVGVSFIVLNYDIIKGKNTKPDTNGAPDREKVEGYKERFRSRTTEELQTLSKDERYTQDARTAVAELLAERES